MLGSCNEPTIRGMQGWPITFNKYAEYVAEFPRSPPPSTMPLVVSLWVMTRPLRVEQWLKSESDWNSAGISRARLCEKRSGSEITITGFGI